jgi:hypothetical protein
MQILMAWRGNRWVVERNTVEVGAYAYRTHAMERAKALSADAYAAGEECYLLIREPDGQWQERPCPRPVRQSGAA